MKHLSGPEVWSGSLAMNLPFVVMGAIVQSKLKGEKSDLLTPEKLLEVAHSKGTVLTRVRYNWITDDETGRLKAVGYHTSTESGRDQVRVRMLEKQMDGSYEFWGDERIDKPLITWTPASTPGSQDSWNTGNNSPQAGTVTIPGLEHPEIQGVTITTTPVPEEKDFRDYILVFPGTYTRRSTSTSASPQLNYWKLNCTRISQGVLDKASMRLIICRQEPQLNNS